MKLKSTAILIFLLLTISSCSTQIHFENYIDANAPLILTIHKINSKEYGGNQIKDKLMKDLSISEDAFHSIKNKLAALIKEFPDIAVKAISDFAKMYGFNKISISLYLLNYCISRKTKDYLLGH